MAAVKKNKLLKKAKEGAIIKNFSKPISAEYKKGGNVVKKKTVAKKK